jgi:[protein-PII] uridylyltransferase
MRRRRPPGTIDPSTRTPLAADVVAQGGEVVLARDADPWADPGLVLRVARAAAEHDLPISNFALSRLASESAPMPKPWPAMARDSFIGLLGAGAAAVPSLEALDQHGLLSRLIPEWECVRYLAQHNPVHVYTVDRHLIETAVQASRLAAEVARPDLLLMGAFLHDIGKGRGEDHSVVGARLARDIAERMGFSPADTGLITAQVRHHLLLPDTATRRDIDDPSTITLVVNAIERSTELLGLLHQLTIADAAATGPAAWSDWKARLVVQLVNRVSRALDGEPLPPPERPAPEILALVADGSARVVRDGAEVIVIAPDAPGLLSRASGLLALHSLNVQAADVRTVDGVAVNRFTVLPRFGEYPAESVLNADLRRILNGSLRLEERLHAKEARYTEADRRPPLPRDLAPLRVLWFDDEATDASVVEVRTRDGIALLHRVTAELERQGLDIRSARISSLGAYVVDAFYVTDTTGGSVVEVRQSEVTAGLTRTLSQTAPAAAG